MSKMALRRTLLVSALLAGALYLVLHLGRPASVGTAIGQPGPDFVLPALTSGSVALRDYRDRVVVLNFWATWCPPCVQESPSLAAFAEKVRKSGIVVIGVSMDRDTTALRKFATDFHLSYPIALDPEWSVASRYGTYKLPETYILDREGRIAEKVIGAIDWQDPRILTFVESLASPSK